MEDLAEYYTQFCEFDLEELGRSARKMKVNLTFHIGIVSSCYCYLSS